MAEEETGGRLTDKLDKIVELLQKDITKKEKKFKLPFGVSDKKIKKNWIIVILLRTNKNLDIRFLPIENDMIRLKDNETYHLATTDFVLRYKKYPVIILPEWSLKPIAPDELMEQTIQNKEYALPQKVIINAVKMAQLKDQKKGLGGGIIWIIVAIVGAIVAYQVFLKKK